MFKGSYVALVTPFNEDLSINFDMITQLIEWQINMGTDGFIICGTTGEATTMSADEKIAVINHAVNVVNGRKPIIAGTGSNDTNATIKFSNRVENLGVDGLLIITPYYLKTNKEGMYQHFKTIADNVNTPIIIYNVPSRTNVNISVDTVVRLSSHKNIVGIKEASGDLSQVRRMILSTPTDFLLLSGSDEINAEILNLGGDGIISVFGNIAPKVCKEIVNMANSNHIDIALQLQSKYLPLINTLFIEPNPIPVKEALNFLGFDVGMYRLPLWKMSSENVEVLKGLLDGLAV